jgi:hypothetical protein
LSLLWDGRLPRQPSLEKKTHMIAAFEKLPLSSSPCFFYTAHSWALHRLFDPTPFHARSSRCSQKLLFSANIILPNSSRLFDTETPLC